MVGSRMRPLSSAEWRTFADILQCLVCLLSLASAVGFLLENVRLRRERAAMHAELQRWRLSMPPERRLTRVWRSPPHA